MGKQKLITYHTCWVILIWPRPLYNLWQGHIFQFCFNCHNFFQLWMDLIHTWTRFNTSDLTNRLNDFDLTLTSKIIFFNFALIVITFSFFDGFNSYSYKTTIWLDLDICMTLTGKIRFFNFALIVAFSFIDGFYSYFDNTYDLVNMLGDFDLTLTFKWHWPTRSLDLYNYDIGFNLLFDKTTLIIYPTC